MFDASSRLLTTSTPLGRQVATTVDSIWRPLAVSIDGMDPIECAYDFGARGRLIHLKQADRAWRYAYDGSGRLTSLTDTLGRVTSFGYDDADRVTTQTMPDSQVVSYGYDHNGNLTSVTPPGRPAQGFDYTSVDLSQHYTPPDIGIGPVATTYSYNLDRQLTRTARPDGVNVDLSYDAHSRTSHRLDSYPHRARLTPSLCHTPMMVPCLYPRLGAAEWSATWM